MAVQVLLAGLAAFEQASRGNTKAFLRRFVSFHLGHRRTNSFLVSQKRPGLASGSCPKKEKNPWPTPRVPEFRSPERGRGFRHCIVCICSRAAHNQAFAAM